MTEFLHYVGEEHGRISPKISRVKISIGDLVGITDNKLGTKHEVISLERFVRFWKKMLTLSMQ